MSKAEELAMAGNPVANEMESVGVKTGSHSGAETAETWTDPLRGFIGGTYFVTLMIKCGHVISIYAKQKSPM